jgi:hypothetical protein
VFFKKIKVNAVKADSFELYFQNTKFYFKIVPIKTHENSIWFIVANSIKIMKQDVIIVGWD